VKWCKGLEKDNNLNNGIKTKNDLIEEENSVFDNDDINLDYGIKTNDLTEEKTSGIAAKYKPIKKDKIKSMKKNLNKSCADLILLNELKQNNFSDEIVNIKTLKDSKQTYDKTISVENSNIKSTKKSKNKNKDTRIEKSFDETSDKYVSKNFEVDSPNITQISKNSSKLEELTSILNKNANTKIKNELNLNQSNN